MKEIKLNLGCGKEYKKGYVNIDQFDKSVADKVCDSSDLPYGENTIDLIEASQLIEHFDYVHCKYVLSEWFRVLKPEGTLMIETPDFERTFKKFAKSDLMTQKKTLQWIFGIDSPGMQHKAGFTFKLLKDLLEGAGFGKVRKKEQETHKYEPGMRVICIKPKDYQERQLFANFRKNLKDKLKTDDSYILIPLESWLEKISLKDPLDEAIAKTAYCNPKIPLAFIEECIKSGTARKAEAKEKIGFLNLLIKKQFHKRACALWMKGKKDKGFDDFSERMESLLSDALKDGDKERLKYIMGLKPKNIEIFDIHLVP